MVRYAFAKRHEIAESINLIRTEYWFALRSFGKMIP